MASNHALPVVPADVIYWDSTVVNLECPFCEEVHTHGFTSYLSEGRRSPHCALNITSLPSYRFRFPFDPPSCGFEIDKQRGRYSIPGRSDFDPRDEVTDRLAALELGGDHTQLECPMGFECPSSKHILDDGSPCGHTISYFFSYCIVGNEEGAASLLQSCDPIHFLRAKNEEGNTALHLAAIDGRLDIVQLLHKTGAFVDEPNNEGRTALMEAALWGRWRVFRYLFEGGGDIWRTDLLGQRAKDFAAETKRNRELRSQILGKNSTFDHEHAAAERRIILSVVATEMQDPLPAPRTIESIFRFIKDHTQTGIVLQESVAKWEVAIRKTVGLLVRPEGFARISTHSGWRHSEWTTGRGDLMVLSGNIWTAKVIELAKEVGYEIPKHEFDRGKPGLYYACHAEKQLMAFFVSKHVFLPSDRENDFLRGLVAIEPDSRHRLRSAKIYVSTEICKDCRSFQERLNSKLDICIMTEKA
jgi:Ankyrin repeats (3 copies)